MLILNLFIIRSSSPPPKPCPVTSHEVADYSEKQEEAAVNEDQVDWVGPVAQSLLLEEPSKLCGLQSRCPSILVVPSIAAADSAPEIDMSDITTAVKMEPSELQTGDLSYVRDPGGRNTSFNIALLD